MKTNISAVILTKNEEKNISDCIDTLSFCAEIIVIDDNSNDKTTLLAKKKGARVFIHDLEGDFSKQRNYGLSKAQEEWVLFIDADERVSKELADEIYQQTSQFLTQSTAFRFKREDVMWGKRLRHGEVGKMFLVRLIKKGKGEWIGKVHETLQTLGDVQTLKNPLYHYPHDNIRDFLKQINIYSSLRAQELIDKKTRVNFLAIIFYPLSKFLLNYVVKMGFRDGTAGIVHAMMMSFHSFLVRSKVWALQHKKNTSF